MRFPAALLALLVLSGCTESGGTPPLSTTVPSSPATFAGATPPPVEVDIKPFQNQDDGAIHFASPTRNILCDLGSDSDIDYLGCHIREHEWQIKDCPRDGAAWLSLGMGDDEAAHVGCAEFPTNGSQYRVLPYGHKISGINITCASTEVGVTCHDDREPYGRFFLSRAKYSLDKWRG